MQEQNIRNYFFDLKQAAAVDTITVDLTTVFVDETVKCSGNLLPSSRQASEIQLIQPE